MKTLGRKIRNLIRDAVKSSGTFDPDDNICMFIEEITHDEYKVIHKFLTWVHFENKTFGHNIEEVYQEFLKVN